MPASMTDSCLYNLKAEENMLGAGEDSSEDEHMNGMWGILDLNPHTVKENSLVDGFIAYSHFLLLF